MLYTKAFRKLGHRLKDMHLQALSYTWCVENGQSCNDGLSWCFNNAGTFDFLSDVLDGECGWWINCDCDVFNGKRRRWFNRKRPRLCLGDLVFFLLNKLGEALATCCSVIPSPTFACFTTRSITKLIIMYTSLFWIKRCWRHSFDTLWWLLLDILEEIDASNHQ